MTKIPPEINTITIPPIRSGEKFVLATIGQVLNCRRASQHLFRQDVGVELARRFLNLKRFLDAVGSAFGKRRNEVVAEVGKKEKNGWKLDSKAQMEYEKKIVKIAEEPLQIPQDVCIYMRDLSRIMISAEDLESLAFVILDFK
jgi:hypothetical protein